jgi:uncharacterized protein (PEP-CTERM system associated)
MPRSVSRRSRRVLQTGAAAGRGQIRKLRWLRPLVACSIGVGVAPALAQTWTILPSLGVESTLTDNVRLTPTGGRTDWVNQITPSLAINERGAHSNLSGSILLPIVLYTRESGSDTVRPEISLSGNAELYPRLFYIDASAQVSQQFVSPFGPRPQDLITSTDNRQTVQSYRISPYFKGEAANDIRYELRNSNEWTNASGTGDFTGRSYTNDTTANVSREPRPFGASVDYHRTDTDFSSEDRSLMEIARLNASWKPNPEWELTVGGGYENNRFPLDSFAGPTYRAEVRWHPSDRTNVDAWWEHRFFGGSYHFTLDHRTPLTAWSITAFRDITTYPQQLGTFSTGGDVNALLNSLFSSRLPDPIQRQAAVQAFIRDRGLPLVLTGPLSLVSQQVSLQESVQGTASILGARNSILVTIYRTRSEPVAGQTNFVADSLSQIDNTQRGVNAVWAYRLTPLYTLSSSIYWSRTVGNDVSGTSARQASVQTMLSAPLSPLTVVYAGVRHQEFTSNTVDRIRENSVFVGVNHRFH